jgi:hypothetical protein
VSGSLDDRGVQIAFSEKISMGMKKDWNLIALKILCWTLGLLGAICAIITIYAIYLRIALWGAS